MLDSYGAGPDGHPSGVSHRQTLPRALRRLTVRRCTMARDRKPVCTARQNEIIEEIVVSLRPWKKGKTEFAITNDVKNNLNGVIHLAQAPPPFPTRTQVREHAKQLDHALCEVERLLPGPSMVLFDPLPSVKEVKRLRRMCAYAISRGFGHHANFDHTKRWCALFASCLICDLSAEAATGTADGPFRMITSLLYEAATGQGAPI